ncbi:MAG: hypothetical protein WA810_05055 [Maribacter sp.]
MLQVFEYKIECTSATRSRIIGNPLAALRISLFGTQKVLVPILPPEKVVKIIRSDLPS